MDDRPAVRAYDAAAATYDAALASVDWVRERLQRRYRALFPAGAHILDAGCGTGVDALALARAGYRVTAVDSSRAMLEATQARIVAAGLADRLHTVCTDFRDLATLPDASHDGMISAFAAINTLSDPGPFIDAAARVLKPSAPFVWHLLNRASWWECLRLMVLLQPARALRTWRRTSRVVTIGGVAVPHTSFPPSTLRARCAPAFRVTRCWGIGFLLPNRVTATLPDAVARLVGRLEAPLAAIPPIVRASTYLVLEGVRRS